MKNPITQCLAQLLTRVPWLILFAALLLASALGMAWALPGYAALGQTIPPPPTATPTPAVIIPVQPTATWTPRPTWTQMPTMPPGLPTATPSQTVASPTPTRTESVSSTPALPLGRTPTSEPTPSPSPAPTRQAMGLVCEVAVQPPIAGPADSVHFILQVANVGYEPIAGVAVSLAWPEDLVVQSIDCERCIPTQEGARWRLSIGRLLPGEQVIAPILAQVAEDAWPGQRLRTDWTLTAVDLPTRHVEAFVELPWAELPATGSVVSGVAINEWRNE